MFDIVPLDGTWKGTVRVQEISGCLPQVARMVPPLVDAMGSVKRITWGGRFHPSQFVVKAAPDRIIWKELSAMQFEGVFPIPRNDTLDVSVPAASTLTAPDRAKATMALRLSAAKDADAASMAMIGMEDCRVDAIHDSERTGP